MLDDLEYQEPKRGRMHVGLIEYAVFNYPSPEFEGWRFFRIEYGGHAESCIKEVHLWLPPGFDVYKFEDELLKAALGESDGS